jgi:hypothetical protein
LVKHLRYVDASPGARVVLVTKPGEWGLCYLQLASIRRWAPKVLPHVTVLTYDEATHDACSTQRWGAVNVMNPVVPHTLNAPGFNPQTYEVRKPGFKICSFKINLYRYEEGRRLLLRPRLCVDTRR